jgi:ketosteroid isomerase-like protein
MDTDANVAIALKAFEYFNRHDWEGMASLYADPAEFRDPSLGLELVMQTRKDIIDKYAEMGRAIPDLRDDVSAVYPSGDKHVIIEFVSSGSTPDGGRWKLPICTIMTIEDGLITKDYTYYDRT